MMPRAIPASGAALVWPVFLGAVLGAWVVLVLVALAGPSDPGLPGFWDALCRPAAAAPLGTLWAMWALMALAMMLPTFAPALRSWRALSATGATDGASAAALTGGYLAVWLAVSALFALAQKVLAGVGWLAPDGSSLRPMFTAALLAGAGLWQFTGVKAACLSRCRLPLTHFLERWRPGLGPAFRIGAGMGLHCLGCCWALMALAFVGGTMHLGWMGAATAFMAAEKLQAGAWLTRPAGVLLLAAGAAVAAGWTI